MDRTTRSITDVPIQIVTTPTPLLRSHKGRIEGQHNEICQTGLDNVSVPIRKNVFKRLSSSWKMSFLVVNYPQFTNIDMLKIVNSFTYFSYLYNNCNVDVSVRDRIGGVIKSAIK